MLLALAAFYTAYKGVLLLEGRRHISRGIVYFVVATVLLVIAGWRARELAAASDDPPSETDSPDRWTGRWARARRLAALCPELGWWGLLLAATGLGFAFRLYHLGSLPYGVWFDEAQNGIVARRILDDSSYRPVFVGGVTQLPALFFYVFAIAIKLIGHGILALRSVTTIAGILTLPFVFLLARELFDRRVAVLATFFLAVMRWHVNFSRFAMHGILAPLFMAATFYFLARALKGKGPWNFFLAGVMAGVGLQGYFSFLLVPFIVVLYLLHHAIFQRTLAWQKLGLGVAIFAVVTAGVYSPVGIWALRNPDQFNKRVETLTITKNRSASEVADVVWKSTRKHLLMFNSIGDPNGRHDLPGAPMLDTYTGFLFVLGAGYALWRWRDSGHFLLLAWMVVTLQGGIWSAAWEAPQAYRTVGVTPAIAMLAALPLGLLWRLATERPTASAWERRSWQPRLGYCALGAVATLVTVCVLAETGRANFDTYFNLQTTSPAVWQTFSPEATIVGREVRRLGTGYRYYLGKAFVDHPTFLFLTQGMEGLDVGRLDLIRDVPSSAPSGAVYFLLSDDPMVRALKSFYLDSTVRTFTPPGTDHPIFVSEVVVSASSVAAAKGIDALYSSVNGSEVVRRREPSLDLDWTEGTPLSTPFRAGWAGALKVKQYGPHRLEVEAPGSIRLTLDGEEAAVGQDRVEVNSSLFVGDHPLQLEVLVDRPGWVRLSLDGAVPADALFVSAVAGRGLLGTYYANDGWTGDPVLIRLDPVIAHSFQFDQPYQPPLSIRWTGRLTAPTDGPYGFHVFAGNETWVTVDGVTVLHAEAVTRFESGGSTVLRAGEHDIEVRFRCRDGPSDVFLYWRRPNGLEEAIGPEYLSPR